MTDLARESEPTPDLEEVLQEEASSLISTVPVRIEEAAGFWLLPNRHVRYDSNLVGDTTWVQVLDGSKKRARAVLMAIAQPIRIRTSSSGTGMLWPAAVPFPVFHTEKVQVLCATGAATVEVGISEEFWAD
jgi:hypothetical protein